MLSNLFVIGSNTNILPIYNYINIEIINIRSTVHFLMFTINAKNIELKLKIKIFYLNNNKLVGILSKQFTNFIVRIYNNITYAVCTYCHF